MKSEEVHIIRFRPAKTYLKNERVARRENGLSKAITRCLFVKIKKSSFPGHAPGKDTLRAANAATERGLTGENARANAVSGRALSPVLPKEGANGGENRGIHGRDTCRFCPTDLHRCIFKALANSDVLSADFSSPWHKSDGQNCVAPAMERFSSEFWCGGRRNTRVFQGRQAGNHRKSPMSGGTDPFHVCLTSHAK